MSDFEKLLTDYGNAVFDCGEYDLDNGSTEVYNAMLEVAKQAKRKVLDYVRQHTTPARIEQT